MDMLNAATIRTGFIERRSAAIQAAWIFAFAAGTAVGAQIEIPHQPVPYTLQTFFVLLAGAVLGKRNGALSQSLYLIAGAIGLPVFSHWAFGFARLVGPTGGYLLGFPVAAFAVGYILQRYRGLLGSAVGMAAGLFIVFSLGTLRLYFFYDRDFAAAFFNGFLIFTPWDLLKLCGAVLVYRGWLRRTPGQD